ncbi:MAG: hypothetical protein AAB229_01790 [Candidatus Hydrogenedentota bacterium]
MILVSKLLGGFLAIATLLSIPLWSHESSTTIISLMLLVMAVGALAAGLIFKGRAFGTTGVFAAFGLGMPLKLLALVAVYFHAVGMEGSVSSEIVFAIASFLLFHLWTSYLFQVSSHALKK